MYVCGLLASAHVWRREVKTMSRNAAQKQECVHVKRMSRDRIVTSKSYGDNNIYVDVFHCSSVL